MIYTDGAETDEEGMFTVCPRCGSTDRADAGLCPVCRTPRRNICMAVKNPLEWHVNPPNARFCETCGAQTLLSFHKALLPWREARDLLLRPFSKEELPF